jgi:hypothetical protein
VGIDFYQHIPLLDVLTFREHGVLQLAIDSGLNVDALEHFRERSKREFKAPMHCRS